MQLLGPSDARAFLERIPAALFVDCRSEMEHLFVGHLAGAHRVSWSDGPHWEVNPEFVPIVRKLIGHGIKHPVVLTCRNGNRSAAAAHALEEAGFRGVYVMHHGFEGDLDSTRHRNTLNGWRHTGLPQGRCQEDAIDTIVDRHMKKCPAVPCSGRSLLIRPTGGFARTIR